MTVKTILSVDVDPDGNFERFNQLFDEYSAKLARTPNAWKNASKESAAMATQFERMAAALMAQGKVDREQAEARKAQEKQLTSTSRLWTSIDRSAKSVTGSILTATKALLSWGTVLGAAGGLIGLGGLWGIDRMAERAGDQRRSATGLGLTIGQQKSFEFNLGRFVNPSSFLSGISEATADPAKQGGLYALGVNPNGNPSDVAIAALKSIRSRALATPENQLGLLESQYGLGGYGIGLEDLRRLRSASNVEFSTQLRNYGQNQGALGIDDKTAEKWQTFSGQMEKAGQTIFKTFVEGLGPLSGPLKNLSDSIVGLIAKAFPKDGSGPIERGVDTLAHWVDDFADTLKSGDFQSNVKELVSDTGELASAVKKIRDAYADPVSAAWNAIKSDATDGQVSRWNTVKDAMNWLNGKFSPASALVSMNESRYGLPSGLESYVWGKESDRQTSSPDSPKGAMGPFQIMKAMAAGYDVRQFDQGAQRAAQILSDELRHYGGDVQKSLVAYNRGDSAADKLFASDPNWRKEDKYSRDWSGPPMVTIYNKTGADIVAVGANIGTSP